MRNRARENRYSHGMLRIAALTIVTVLATACASISGGPPRLYSIEEETNTIRNNLEEIRNVRFSAMDEPTRTKYRNDWIGARMHAIDLQYTAYESALTRERQNIGFGAAAATLGLTTASGLIAPVATKNLLTGIAGFVTGTRAAYDNDVLLAHSVQWIQTQMRTKRSIVAEQIIRGMRASTVDYPLAAALTDLEEYYRAGTFTGGMIATTETLGIEARFAEAAKADRIEATFVSTPVAQALSDCLLQDGVRQEQLVNLMAQPSRRNFALLLTGQSPEVAQVILQRARNAGICR